jgi:hypothetical protein
VNRHVDFQTSLPVGVFKLATEDACYLAPENRSKLPDGDFAEAVKIAQAEFDKHQPQVVIGSSRDGAVAMNSNSGEAKLVLLCPAWKKWGNAKREKLGTSAEAGIKPNQAPPQEDKLSATLAVPEADHGHRLRKSDVEPGLQLWHFQEVKRLSHDLAAAVKGEPTAHGRVLTGHPFWYCTCGGVGLSNETSSSEEERLCRNPTPTWNAD